MADHTDKQALTASLIESELWAIYKDGRHGYEEIARKEIRRLALLLSNRSANQREAFEAAFPFASECRDGDGYHCQMAVRWETWNAALASGAVQADAGNEAAIDKMEEIIWQTTGDESSDTCFSAMRRLLDELMVHRAREEEAHWAAEREKAIAEEAAAQAGGQGEAVELARRLAEEHPKTLRTLYSDGDPIGRRLVELFAAAAVEPAAPAVRQPHNEAEAAQPPSAQPGQEERDWIAVEDRKPNEGQRVEVKRYAGRVANPAHPGYPGKEWIEETTFERAGFWCDFLSTGYVTHWRAALTAREGE